MVGIAAGTKTLFCAFPEFDKAAKHNTKTACFTIIANR
jgi:hypothetical protein